MLSTFINKVINIFYKQINCKSNLIILKKDKWKSLKFMIVAIDK